MDRISESYIICIIFILFKPVCFILSFSFLLSVLCHDFSLLHRFDSMSVLLLLSLPSSNCWQYYLYYVWNWRYILTFSFSTQNLATKWCLTNLNRDNGSYSLPPVWDNIIAKNVKTEILRRWWGGDRHPLDRSQAQHPLEHHEDVILTKLAVVNRS